MMPKSSGQTSWPRLRGRRRSSSSSIFWRPPPSPRCRSSAPDSAGSECGGCRAPPYHRGPGQSAPGTPRPRAPPGGWAGRNCASCGVGLLGEASRRGIRSSPDHTPRRRHRDRGRVLDARLVDVAHNVLPALDHQLGETTVFENRDSSLSVGNIHYNTLRHSLPLSFAAGALIAVGSGEARPNTGPSPEPSAAPAPSSNCNVAA